MLMSSPQILLFLLFASFCFLLSDHVVASAPASPFSFSFDFSNRSSYRFEDLLFEGDAVPQANLVDLTCSSRVKTIFNCTGRMSYNYPVLFYDTSTGEVASFSTLFNFTITLPGKYPGNGMAFFLSSFPSMLPNNSDGGKLGLHSGDGAHAEGTKRFVAVEFDTYDNSFDPPNSPSHIGIDINSVRASVNTTNVTAGINGSMTATVTFNSSTRMLVAFLSFNDQPSRGSYQVSRQLPDPVTDLLPSEVAVGFSAATGANVELHQMMSWSFNSTLAPTPLQDKKRNSTPIVLIAVIVPVILIFLLAGMCLLRKLYWKEKSGGNLDYAMFEEETPLHIDIRRFTYAELSVITKNFESIIGRGGFSIVYHGILENGDEVAVKILTETSIAESIDFLPEVQTLSKVHHKNLVTLQGYCQNKKCLALVYDFMPRGNLQQLLRGDDDSLSWEQRLHIAFDAAQGLEYLHELCTPSIVHRDVKTPNILLDKNLVGIISDFGLARAFSDAHTHISTVAAGTLGYLDPEYHATFQLTVKTDVYSFGIVLLEIITGQPPVIMNPQPVHLPNWVRQNIAKGSIHDVVDKRLLGQYNGSSLQSVIDLAMCCVENASTDRPAMTEVVSRLKVWLPVVSTEKKSIHGTTQPKKSLDREISNQFQLTISGESTEGSSFQSGYTSRMSEISISSGT